jgi:hypothetical protein
MTREELEAALANSPATEAEAIERMRQAALPCDACGLIGGDHDADCAHSPPSDVE